MTRLAVKSDRNDRRIRAARGQVFTPASIARWMTAWACEKRPKTILEPGAGSGVLIDAIREMQSRKRRWRPAITAYETDAALCRHLGQRDDVEKLTICELDFINDEIGPRFDACVANPPYVRHHQLDYDDAVFSRFDQMIGERLSRMSNLYGLFMLRIWQRLAPDGRAAVITPAEWLNADFGKPIKRYFQSENAIDSLIVFDDDALPFDDALTTAAITLLRRDRSRDEPVRVVRVANADALAQLDIERAVTVAPADLDPSRKWSRLIHPTNPRALQSRNGTTLGDIATCMRGIATGANQFFTLTESERRTHRISRRDVVPCITKAANLDHEQFERTQLRRLIASNRKVWLLRPRTPLDDAVRDYLKVGVTLGIPERYLPAHRPEWYRPEQRSPAPIWVPVFARDQFRFVQNETDALHLTTFHGLYPNEPAGHDAIGTIVQFLRSAEGQRNVIAHTRIYGGGLRKLEPRDVLAIEIPTSIACAIRNSSDQKIEQSGNESLQ